MCVCVYGGSKWLGYEIVDPDLRITELFLFIHPTFLFLCVLLFYLFFSILISFIIIWVLRRMYIKKGHIWIIGMQKDCNILVLRSINPNR